MNTAETAAPAATQEQKPAQIGVNLATLLSIPKPTVSDALWATYIACVKDGIATKKNVGTKEKPDWQPILAGKLSGYAITGEQRKQLQDARRDYRHACMKRKKDAQKLLGAKSSHLIAWRAGTKTETLKIAKEKAFKSPLHWQAYRDGVKVADLRAAQAK